jgi:hypothetical protein
MKTPLIGLSILALVSLTACGSLTSSPPLPVEAKLFNIQTNLTPQVQMQTNVVTVRETNVVTVINPLTQVQYQTNQVTVQTVATNIVTVTNEVPSYVFTPKAAVTNDAAIIGTVANGFLPGFGGLITTGITGLLGLWATLRTKSQGNQVAANLAQAIETARSVIKSLPNGATVGSQFDDFLVQHQTDANLLNEIAPLVDKYVNPDAAQGAATKIIQLVTTPLNAAPPVAAAPSNS